MEIVSKIASCIGLREICLSKLECNKDDECFVEGSTRQFSVQSFFRAKVIEPIKGENIRILADFKIEAVDDSNTEESNLHPNKKTGFSINASFILLYCLPIDTGFSIDDLNMFANVNGIFNCWPYWRELVQSLTTRMGLTSLTIPLLKIPKADSKDKHRKSKKIQQ